jgi:phage tail sheath protein FI
MYLFKKSGLIFLTLLSLNSMAQIKKPGVFVQEIAALPPSVAQVETAIPAFIGYTEKADEKGVADLLFKGRRVSSLIEYEKYFGKGYHIRPVKLLLDNNNKVSRVELDHTGYLLYESVKNYFNNGGGPCYIISIGGYFSKPRSSDFQVGLNVARKLDEITLLLLPEAVNLSGADLYEIQQLALEQAGSLADRFCIMDLKYAEDKITHDFVVAEFRNWIGTNQLKYGAAYTPFVKTMVNQEYAYREWKDIIWKIDRPVKLSQVITDPVFVQQLTELEQLIASNNSAEQQKEREILASFPEMKAIADKMRQAELALPPSSAIAGVYCSVDRTRGVWKAPANVALYGYNKPILSFNDRLQEELNVDVTTGKSINVIREFSGRGTQVWGARTLAGNDNEWRYVPVRRFYITVEESIKKATDRFVFEPNDANTWTRIKSMIENYLVLKWREGALVGTKPEQAFFVNVGLGKTMTNQDILEGRLIVEVGMAAVRPAEFIILKFQLKMVTK